MTGPDHRWRREAEEARQRAGDAEERAARLLAERDALGFALGEARLALRDVLDALGRDDNPRRAAIESARVLVARWNVDKTAAAIKHLREVLPSREQADAVRAAIVDFRAELDAARLRDHAAVHRGRRPPRLDRCGGCQARGGGRWTQAPASPWWESQMRVPEDLLRRLECDCAYAMAVPTDWVLRAAIEHFLAAEAEDQVEAVERARDADPAVIAWKRERASRAAVCELTQEAQSMGLYDDGPTMDPPDREPLYVEIPCETKRYAARVIRKPEEER